MPIGDDYLNQFNQSLLKQPAPAQLDPTKMNAVLQALGTNLMKPVDAAQNIMGQGDRPPSQMTIDPGKEAFMAGPMAMMPMFNQAPAGSVGITASRLMQRTDMPKIVKELKAQGLTEQQIAKNINDRFASELDYGQSVRRNQVNQIYQKLKGQEVSANVAKIPESTSIIPGITPSTGNTYSALNTAGRGPNTLADSQNIKDLQIWQNALPYAKGGRKAFVEQKIKELQDKINGR